MRFVNDLIDRFCIGVSLLVATFIVVSQAHAEAPYEIGGYYWPTPNPAFLQGKGMDSIAQPTVSGKTSSAFFGCVRNNGTRFHEGLDIKPIIRDGKGESLDSIYSFADGVVRYVNSSANASSYGRYVVVEHPQIAPGVVTLYAHLRSIDRKIREGVKVAGGTTIARMGRSASYVIPKSRAHLHFEIAYWLGPEFQKWYDQQPFSSKNDHGTFNGMNLVGFDTVSFWKALRSGEVGTLEEFIASEPIAYVVEAPFDDIPDLLQVNPQLMTNDFLPTDLAGWRVEFTWYGVPVRWTALNEGEISGKVLSVVESDERFSEHLRCFEMKRGGTFPGPGARLKSLISRLFVN
ncbi:M23 family metallopeptidase [Puniceicoccaceae bacterium K14]|nr:M23 family metallopeptidase [Puniceicoccaceae bacterium K14]